MKKLYKARWSQAGKPTLGSVDFYATNDGIARRKAVRIAKEIGLPHTPYAITESGRLVASMTP